MRTFIQDIAPKRALRATVYRAPFRKGTVSAVQEPSLPRGYFCIRPEDIPGQKVLSYSGYSLPILSKSEVRYLGEPLLLFCGPNAEVLGKISASVQLSFEEQTPVEYKDLTGPYPEAQIINLGHGDVDLAFSLAEQIVEGEYRTARQEHCYPDTQGAVADWNGKILILHAATQDPFGLQSAICACLSLPQRKVRVVAVPVGNSMEGKLLSSFLVAAHAALLSFKAEKPVVLIYDREEDLRFSPKNPQFLIRHQTALDRDGGTMAVRVQIYMDGGCYPPRDSGALRRAVHSAWGAYQIPNLEVTGRALATDFPPIGPFRASGRAPAIFAAELHSSRLEEIAQLDPYTWKRENLAKAGRREESSPPFTVLAKATEMSDFTRKYSAYSAVKKRRKTIEQGGYPLRGIGLSLASQNEGGPWACMHAPEESRGSCALKLVLERGSRVRIYTSLVDCAMGIHGMFIQRAAQLLDIDPDRISVQPVDTQDVPDTGPTSLSLAAMVGFPLLEQCCHALQRRRKNATLPIEVRRSLSLDRTRPGRAHHSGQGRTKAVEGMEESSWAATVVELMLDPVTFQSTCRGVWMVIESGRVWNRKSALRVLEGEILRALGSSRLPGYPTAGSDRGFACSSGDLIPGTADLPEIRVHLLEEESADMKGFEQLPHLGVPAAYAAAISQATGLYIDQIPITAEVIQQCLET
ncbi:MAG: molybdopterin-dependent oxidoreductase [Spirochaetaceae bacterium]|nr:MAG: molybdopterin-dependent oxidoreductase [Spirochaetaceae bacterium]